MKWSKQKQLLESFLAPSLIGRVEYGSTSYRYSHHKPGRSYITVDKKQVFQMSDDGYEVKWYDTVMDIKRDEGYRDIPVTEEDISEVTKMGVPAEVAREVARKRKVSAIADKILKEQGILSRSDFQEAATLYLSSSIESCLDSDSILLNIFALMDRRVGKKRLRNIGDTIKLKHPIVQYFYKLRLEAEENK